MGGSGSGLPVFVPRKGAWDVWYEQIVAYYGLLDASTDYKTNHLAILDGVARPNYSDPLLPTAEEEQRVRLFDSYSSVASLEVAQRNYDRYSSSIYLGVVRSVAPLMQGQVHGEGKADSHETVREKERHLAAVKKAAGKTRDGGKALTALRESVHSQSETVSDALNDFTRHKNAFKPSSVAPRVGYTWLLTALTIFARIVASGLAVYDVGIVANHEFIITELMAVFVGEVWADFIVTWKMVTRATGVVPTPDLLCEQVKLFEDERQEQRQAAAASTNALNYQGRGGRGKGKANANSGKGRGGGRGQGSGKGQGSGRGVVCNRCGKYGHTSTREDDGKCPLPRVKDLYKDPCTRCGRHTHRTDQCVADVGYKGHVIHVVGAGSSSDPPQGACTTPLPYSQAHPEARSEQVAKLTTAVEQQGKQIQQLIAALAASKGVGEVDPFLI